MQGYIPNPGFKSRELRGVIYYDQTPHSDVNGKLEKKERKKKETEPLIVLSSHRGGGGGGGGGGAGGS